MSAALRDFAFERSCIEASTDDRSILDWMREYRIDRRDAQAAGDDDVVQELDDLLEFAEDRVVEIKEARNAPAAPKATPTRAEPRVEAVPEERWAVTEPMVVQRATAPPSRERNRSPEPPQRRERDDAAEVAAANKLAADAAVAQQAEADAKRRDDEELRELRERARKAEARVKVAQAETARLKGAQQQAALEQERERRQRAKERAARDAKAQEQAAAEAEAGARAAARGVPAVALTSASHPAPTVAAAQPATAPTDLTPIARLFQERLVEGALAPPATTIAAPKVAGTSRPSAPRTSAKAPAMPVPAADPVDDLPPLTGSDLTSYRTWLGVSQRALASKFTVEQSVISKSEGRPTTVLPPQLRKALHQAMGEPRPDVGGAK